MKNYIGRKINTAIFISGTGSNMRNLIKFSKGNKSPIKVKLVISSNKNAKGIIYENNIYIIFIFYIIINSKR